MKPGFYLSPDGKHIIQIQKSLDFKYLFDVYGHVGGFDDWIEEFYQDDLEVLFSAWERLT
jgi:hypothetical protein